MASYLTMINQNLEECVHEENTIGKNAAAIKENRLKWENGTGGGRKQIT